MFFRLLRLGGWASHSRLLAIALPMIVANVSTPLVGMVDTAVLGHMNSAEVLAGASVAAFIFSQLVWVCGFLRMSITGASAQALGQNNRQQCAKVLWQSILLASILGLVLFMLRPVIFATAINIAELNATATHVAKQYFTIRALSFPFAICNLVLVGWLIGQQQTKVVMWIQVVGNLTNVALNLTLVYVVEMGVVGVAAASVVAEIAMFLLYFRCCLSRLHTTLFTLSWFSKTELLPLLTVNGNMLLRNIVLQVCLAFMTLKGASYGVVAASVNTILMQFFAITALGLDGIAFAVEAQVGKAKGQRSHLRFSQYWVQGIVWSWLVASIYTLVFWVFGADISALFTSHELVLSALTDYVWIIILLPVIGHWCFLFDGVAVGLSEAKAMRNTMFCSALIGFFPIWWCLQAYNNLSLWFAMLTFLSLRGMLLGGVIYYRYFVHRLALRII